jgi:endonuclease/exonuclease/phosphatase family metal-dependent hydrolase
MNELTTNNNVFLRYSRIEQLCNNYDADIKCFQECDKAWRFKLNRMFSDKEYFVEYMKNSNGLSNPIYVSKDKFTIIDSGNFELHEPYELNGKQYESRIVTWVKVQSKVNGETLTMINTHLSLHNSRQIPSCEKIMKFTKDTNTDAYLIAGDFNFTMNHSKKYGIMTSNGTKDMAYAAKNEGITGVMTTTCHGYNSKDDHRRIDYFFGSATLTGKMYTVINELYNGGFASDHYGILTYVDINKAN